MTQTDISSLDATALAARVERFKVVRAEILAQVGQVIVGQEEVLDQILTIQAAGGLWSTGADLVRLGTGWASLLPAALAHEALTMQAQPRQGSGGVGFGWLLGARGDIAEHAGLGLDSAASLLIRVRDHRTQVVLTSRSMPLASLGDRLKRCWTDN